MKTSTHMLATDLDHTFVGRDCELRELLRLFGQSPDDIALVYITGRHIDSVRQLMEEKDLPVPDAIISDVGTKIWHMPSWTEDPTWQQLTENEWDPVGIKETARLFPMLQLQSLPDERRISFTIQDGAETVGLFGRELTERGIMHRLIYSSNRDVDVLPAVAGKGNALEYLLAHHVAPEIQLLVAGDSGNDIDLLTRGWPSVIVGNAQPELVSIPDHPNLFRAERHCAGGIHDAWLHFYGKPVT